jgi:hypothetical protein
MSSSKKEQQRKDENITSTTASTNTTASLSNSQVQQQQEEQRYSLNKAIDETRDNIRKATNEAKSQVPCYTQAAKEYQEQTIQAAGEIADNLIESQKEIVNSFQSSCVPAIEKTYGAFWNYWISPRRMIDMYARAISNITDNTIAATMVVNNTIYSNLDTFKTSIHIARDNLKEASRIAVKSVKIFEHTSNDTSNRKVGF